MDLEIKGINFDRFLEVSSYIKAGVLVFLFILVIVLGYFIDTRNQVQQLVSVEPEEADLKNQLVVWYSRLSVLEKYNEQSQSLSELFAAAMKQLPKYSEIPKLLNNINKIGVENGLEFKLFKPLAEEKTPYYAIIPVRMIIIGNYHQFGRFISELMNLNRVLSVQDFTIQRANEEDVSLYEDKLVMEVVLYTYRNLGEDEVVTDG